MLIEAIKNIPSTKRDLRNFGLVMCVALAVIGGILLWKESSLHWVFFGCAGGMALFGLTLPIVLLPLQKVWMLLAGLLGWVMSRIILSVSFYLVVTPMGLVARLFGKRFLDTRFSREAESYWQVRKPEKDEAVRTKYEEQF
jgi:hypothetical protein